MPIADDDDDTDDDADADDDDNDNDTWQTEHDCIGLITKWAKNSSSSQT